MTHEIPEFIMTFNVFISVYSDQKCNSAVMAEVFVLTWQLLSNLRKSEFLDKESYIRFLVCGHDFSVFERIYHPDKIFLPFECIK